METKSKEQIEIAQIKAERDGKEMVAVQFQERIEELEFENATSSNNPSPH